MATATEINQLFFEVLIAPAYDEDALELLKGKTNRIVLETTGEIALNPKMVRTDLNGELNQDRDSLTETQAKMTTVKATLPTA